MVSHEPVDSKLLNRYIRDLALASINLQYPHNNNRRFNLEFVLFKLNQPVISLPSLLFAIYQRHFEFDEDDRQICSRFCCFNFFCKKVHHFCLCEKDKKAAFKWALKLIFNESSKLQSSSQSDKIIKNFTAFSAKNDVRNNLVKELAAVLLLCNNPLTEAMAKKSFQVFLCPIQPMSIKLWTFDDIDGKKCLSKARSMLQNETLLKNLDVRKLNMGIGDVKASNLLTLWNSLQPPHSSKILTLPMLVYLILEDASVVPIKNIKEAIWLKIEALGLTNDFLPTQSNDLYQSCISLLPKLASVFSVLCPKNSIARESDLFSDDEEQVAHTTEFDWRKTCKQLANWHYFSSTHPEAKIISYIFSWLAIKCNQQAHQFLHFFDSKLFLQWTKLLLNIFIQSLKIYTVDNVEIADPTDFKSKLKEIYSSISI